MGAGGGGGNSVFFFVPTLPNGDQPLNKISTLRTDPILEGSPCPSLSQ